MANFYNEISSNKWKSILLILLFAGMVSVLGVVLGLYWGSIFSGIVLALTLGGIYFLISYYSGDALILSMTGAKLATKPEYTSLINTVEGLAIAAGLSTVPKVYVIEDTALNAFATGRDPQHASVTVTTGLLKKLNKLELEGVIAHELSHVKNYDIRVMMLASVLVGITVLLSDFLLRSVLWGRHDDRDNNQLTIILIIAGIVLAIVAPFIGMLIQLAISRKREFLADASGAMLTRYPKGLADALRKIKSDPVPLVDKANRATAHLFISSPFRKTSRVFFTNLFSTHPPIDERIKKLDEM